MKRSVVRCAIAFMAGALVLGTFTRAAPAQDVGAASRDIEESDDFRLRVSAALTLGRVRPSGARAQLEKALSDAHPAVRTAAAAALGVLGDPGAIPTLERRAASEGSASSKAQMRTSIETLRRAAQGPWQGARYIVQLGEMKNRSGVRGDQASDFLRSATKSRAQSLPGALVADGSDPTLLQQAADHHLPVLLIDGALQRLTQSQKNTQLAFDAAVEFSVRRVPEQMLKGTLSGAATSLGSVRALGNPTLVVQLQNQAIEGAVESAMRGAAQGLAQAAK